MLDLTETIEAKSDQLNAIDLLPGPITIKITKIERKNSKEQPTWIYYEGDKNKPYKPCLTMRRVMIAIWGKDGDAYVGRKMVLFFDKTVTHMKQNTGGIRISHMDGLTEEAKVIVTKSRNLREVYTVLPLLIDAPAEVELDSDTLAAWQEKMDYCKNVAELGEVAKEIKASCYDKTGRDKLSEHYSKTLEKLRCDV